MPIASVLLILQTIKDRGPVSRTDLQHMTGLSWGTITNTTRELLTRKFIREQGALSTRAGRKPVQLVLNSASHCLLGVEIGMRRMEAILVNLAGDILWEEHAELPEGQSPSGAMTLAGDLALRGIAAAEGRTPLGVGMVLPGPFDASRGTLIDRRFPAWKGLPVRELLETRLHMPILLEQHANALALAHRWFGRSTVGASSDFICIHLGDSVELGIVAGGDLFRGHAGMAGRFGHVPLDPKGPPCYCGKRGCVEAYCATAALLTSNGDPQNGRPHTLDELIAQAQAGHPQALASFERLGTYLGLGISSLVQLFDPAFIVLAGATTAAARFFLPTVEQGLGLGQPKIQLSPLTDHAAALGICALLLQNAFEPPPPAPAAASATPEALPA